MLQVAPSGYEKNFLSSFKPAPWKIWNVAFTYSLLYTFRKITVCPTFFQITQNKQPNHYQYFWWVKSSSISSCVLPKSQTLMLNCLSNTCANSEGTTTPGKCQGHKVRCCFNDYTTGVLLMGGILFSENQHLVLWIPTDGHWVTKGLQKINQGCCSIIKFWSCY